MATAIAVAGYPLHVWACHPGPLSHTSPGAGGQERLRASVVEVLEISQAEQESRKSGARGMLKFSELRQREVPRISLFSTHSGAYRIGALRKNPRFAESSVALF